ncbi:PAP2 superfamily protein [Dishui Lake large algae virus 1]|nr:PAP2 superfamily protein [Dishui Lake large algae virus 1]
MKLETWQGIIIALVVYGVVGYANQFGAENQILQYEMGHPPLYDRIHNVLPVVPKLWTDVLTVSIVGYFVLRWGIKYPKVLENYLWIVAILFVGRVIIFTMTQFPPARPECSTRTEGEKLHFRVFKKGWRECKDALYSGHTLHVVLVLLFVLYLSKSTAEKSVLFALVILDLTLILASRIHYTCDVLVATLVTILMFYAWPGVDNVVKNIAEGGIYGIMLKQTHNLMK